MKTFKCYIYKNRGYTCTIGFEYIKSDPGPNLLIKKYFFIEDPSFIYYFSFRHKEFTPIVDVIHDLVLSLSLVSMYIINDSETSSPLFL